MNEIRKNLPTKTTFAVSKTAEIVAAIESGVLIRNLETDEPIRQALRYVFTLIGLRSENIPSDIEKAVLLKFIFDNFGNIAPEEIRIAFELAVAGKFEVEIDHYQRFSSLYLSKVVRAYQSHRQRIALESRRKKEEFERNQASQLTPEEIKKINDEFDVNFIVEPFFDWKKTGKLDLRHAAPKSVFSALFERHKVLKLSKERIESIKVRATFDVDSRIQDLKNTPAATRTEKDLIEHLQTDKGREELIRDRCCELSIVEFFDHLVTEEIDILQILKIEI